MSWALWLQRWAGPSWKEGVCTASLGYTGKRRNLPAPSHGHVAWLLARPPSRRPPGDRRARMVTVT